MSRVTTTIKRLFRGVTEPRVGYLMLRNWTKMLRAGRVGPFVGSVFETLITPDSNPYLARLKRRTPNRLVVSDVLDFQMHLDLDDPGLSRTLLQFGVREETSSSVFRDELRRLRRDVDGDVTVLEIGANLGYFTLIEAGALGRRGKIHAIEPAPRNFEILERNLDQNYLSDAVSTHRLAVGDRDGRAKLYTAEKSNWHSPHRIRDHGDSIEVEMLTTETFLAEQGISADSINVVRLDTEGFEVEIFRGMRSVLTSSSPLLLFVELHPSLRDARELNEVLDQLDACGFRIVSTTLDVYGGRFDHGWYETPAEFESFAELKRHNENSNAAVLLIAKRDGSSRDGDDDSHRHRRIRSR